MHGERENKPSFQSKQKWQKEKRNNCFLLQKERKTETLFGIARKIGFNFKKKAG